MDTGQNYFSVRKIYFLKNDIVRTDVARRATSQIIILKTPFSINAQNALI
jgi:hypothetical protein